MITTLGRLPGDASHYVQAQDWEKLATTLSTRTTDVEVAKIRRLFYPSKTEQKADPTVPGKRRRAGFLEALNDAGYRTLYQFLIESPHFSFPDVHRLIRTPKDEGQIMMDIMAHVVRWVDLDSAVFSDRRKSNKPLLREGLIPHIGLPTLSNRENNEGASTKGAELQSIRLEQKVLDFVRIRMDDLKRPETKAYLSVMPENSKQGAGGYAERFADKFWNDLLSIVEVFIGPRFQPWWTTATLDGQSSPIIGQVTYSAITRALCTLAQRVPEVAENPALNSKEASAQLAAAIDEAVVRWVADRCQQALASSTGQSERAPPVEADPLVESHDGGILETSSPKDGQTLTPPPPPPPSSSASTKYSGFSSTPDLDPSPWEHFGPKGESRCDSSRGESQHHCEAGAETEKQRVEGAEPSIQPSLEAISEPRMQPLEAADRGDEDARNALAITRYPSQPQTTPIRPATRRLKVVPRSRRIDSPSPRTPLPSAASFKPVGNRPAEATWKRGLTATSST